MAAVSYWEKNRQELDIGDVSVDGDAASLLSHGILWALWIGWCRDGCDWKTYNPPVNAIIQVASSINERRRT
jgi:hypothetical protein